MVDNNEQGQSSLQRESAGKLKSSRSDPIPPSDEDSNGFDSLEVVKAAWKRMQLRQDHEIPPVIGGNGTTEHRESPLSFIGMLFASNFLLSNVNHCHLTYRSYCYLKNFCCKVIHFLCTPILKRFHWFYLKCSNYFLFYLNKLSLFDVFLLCFNKD